MNALCGDEITLEARLAEGAVVDALAFQSKGCALCRASASMLVETATGRTAPELAAITHSFVSGFADASAPPAPLPLLDALYDIRRYPARSLCVLLPWTTMAALLQQLNKKG